MDLDEIAAMPTFMDVEQKRKRISPGRPGNPYWIPQPGRDIPHLPKTNPHPYHLPITCENGTKHEKNNYGR